MKNNELRIGNLVHSDFSEKNIKTVVEIKHKMASVKYIRADTNEPHQSMVDYERLIPIPLTEQWLLKAGAEKVADYSFYLENMHIGVYHSKSGGGFVFILSIKDFQIAELKYVHQLQNLYFALTGVELDFSTAP